MWMSAQYSTTNDAKLKAATNVSDSSDHVRHAKLQKDDSEMNSVTEEERKSEGKEKEAESGGTHGQSVRLIRPPSEECFHQVVTFTKRPARRGDTTSTDTSSSEEEDDSCENLTDVRDGSVQLQSECCDSTRRLTNANSNSCITELKSLNRESVEASKANSGNVLEIGSLLQQVQELEDREKWGSTEISLAIDGAQMNEEFKAPTIMKRTEVYKPAQTKVILKKKRCNECFADATFNATDSTIQEQPRSLVENRTFIINDPQYCSAVSATFSLGKPNKLFFGKGKISGRSTAAAAAAAAATLQTPTTVLVSHQTLNDSTGNSSAHTKSPIVNVRKNDISSIRSDHFADSLSNHPSLIDSIGSASVTKCSDAATSENISDEYKDGINRRKSSINELRESLSSKLSRGFLEFTQGSSDRLQKWKNKLQNGRQHKDCSGEPPPPTDREKLTVTNRKQNGHLSDVEVALKYDSTDQTLDAKGLPVSLASTLRTNRPNLVLPTRPASDFNPANGNTISNKTSTWSEGTMMDHRTLNHCEDRGSRTVRNFDAHFQSLRNVQTTSRTVENCDNLSNSLPPPVRITPYSGVKPKGVDIIRPIAFRPYTSRKSDKQQTQVSSSFPFYNSSSNNKRKDDFWTKRLSNSDELKQSSQHSKHTGSNSCTPPSVNGYNRSRIIYQPSTSFQLASTMFERRSSGKFEPKENDDYDVVSEYSDRDKSHTDVDSTINENYSAVHSVTCYNNNLPSEKIAFTATTPNNNASISRSKVQKQSQQNSNSAINVINGISSLNLAKSSSSSSSSQQVSGSNASINRYSSGIHVTPSPSDSGIVDYETIIRDKENELTNVRTTMEQNEEIIVKVYLEKERLWREQLIDLKQKLQASQQGENALRQQIQRCNEEREQFEDAIQNLTNDKRGLQRQCLQIEHELFQLRECFAELIRNRDETVCGPCRKHITCAVAAANAKNSSSITDNRIRPPLPIPRLSKESSSERELRVEVEELKEEVSTLRDTLNEQIRRFTDERERWEEILKSSPSNLLGLLPTNDSCSVEASPQSSYELKVTTDSRSCLVSRDRII